MIVYGSYTDYIIFQDLSEEQMYRILDQVRIQESAEAAEAEEERFQGNTPRPDRKKSGGDGTLRLYGYSR